MWENRIEIIYHQHINDSPIRKGIAHIVCSISNLMLIDYCSVYLYFPSQGMYNAHKCVVFIWFIMTIEAH